MYQRFTKRSSMGSITTKNPAWAPFTLTSAHPVRAAGKSIARSTDVATRSFM
ncbi:hypothetical protein LBMAG42_23320 [Deltaproteobacteria bacterium]|nr:hypothetical protein LBMAG42_23320 [Deltaproteobacteria bacterium]